MDPVFVPRGDYEFPTYLKNHHKTGTAVKELAKGPRKEKSEDKEKRLYAKDNAVCSTCTTAACCTYAGVVSLSALDVFRLANFMQMTPEQFMLEYTQDKWTQHHQSLDTDNPSDPYDPIVTFLRRRIDNPGADCIFLRYDTKEGKPYKYCGVYHARPQLCRGYNWDPCRQSGVAVMATLIAEGQEAVADGKITWDMVWDQLKHYGTKTEDIESENLLIGPNTNMHYGFWVEMARALHAKDNNGPVVITTCDQDPIETKMRRLYSKVDVHYDMEATSLERCQPQWPESMPFTYIDQHTSTELRVLRLSENTEYRVKQVADYKLSILPFMGYRGDVFPSIAPMYSEAEFRYEELQQCLVVKEPDILLVINLAKQLTKFWMQAIRLQYVWEGEDSDAYAEVVTSIYRSLVHGLIRLGYKIGAKRDTTVYAIFQLCAIYTEMCEAGVKRQVPHIRKALRRKGITSKYLATPIKASSFFEKKPKDAFQPELLHTRVTVKSWKIMTQMEYVHALMNEFEKAVDRIAIV